MKSVQDPDRCEVSIGIMGQDLVCIPRERTRHSQDLSGIFWMTICTGAIRFRLYAQSQEEKWVSRPAICRLSDGEFLHLCVQAAGNGKHPF